MLFRLMLSDIGTETLSTEENPLEMLLANCVPLRDDLLNTTTARGLPLEDLRPIGMFMSFDIPKRDNLDSDG